MFFDNPAVRFSRRFSFFQVWMRYRASLLFRWLTGADGLYARIDSRCHEAEFPVATQTAYQLLVGTLWGSRARDRASSDALRPNNNWVKPSDNMTSQSSGEMAGKRAAAPAEGRQRPRHQSAPAKKSFWEKITALLPVETGTGARPVSQRRATVSSRRVRRVNPNRLQ
jgi:hypothetical protein